MRITFVGNHSVSYSSENHHVESLRQLGHEVVTMQEGQATGEEILAKGTVSDLLVVVHTHGWETPGLPLAEVLQMLKGVTKTMTYHLDLWLGLERQKDLDNDPFYKLIDHFFATDKLMADWFNDNTAVKGHYIPAGVYHRECFSFNIPKIRDIIFTGSKGYHPEWPWRPQLINWLHDTYGTGFKHYGNDGIQVVRGLALNELYASTKITIGDTLCINYDYPDYFSDRLFEATGRGAFVIFPYIKGIENYFKLGEEIITFRFGDFEDLKTKIDYYLEHDEEREKIRKAGFERTKKDHTYIKRWEEILNTIND